MVVIHSRNGRGKRAYTLAESGHQKLAQEAEAIRVIWRRAKNDERFNQEGQKELGQHQSSLASAKLVGLYAGGFQSVRLRISAVVPSATGDLRVQYPLVQSSILLSSRA